LIIIAVRKRTLSLFRFALKYKLFYWYICHGSVSLHMVNINYSRIFEVGMLSSFDDYNRITTFITKRYASLSIVINPAVFCLGLD